MLPSSLSIQVSANILIRLRNVADNLNIHLQMSLLLDVCLPNPESLIKGIVDTRDLDGYPQQVVDFYIINVRSLFALAFYI